MTTARPEHQALVARSRAAAARVRPPARAAPALAVERALARPAKVAAALARPARVQGRARPVQALPLAARPARPVQAAARALAGGSRLAGTARSSSATSPPAS